MMEYTGQQFGHYRLLQRLGRGGFADVYLGRHVHLETQAAVKVLHVHLVGAEIERFRQEARTVARLEHPHIVRILDFDVQEGRPFLVMNYAPNGTLRQRHPRGSRVALPLVISYVQQIASALQYAHDLHIIHRDIKPENLLVGGHQEVLLSDFGIACVTPDSQSLQTQEMAGTITYMAPEQIEGHPHRNSDQYSLAVLVYEWLSGQRPFEGSFTEVAFKHSSVPIPSLRQNFPDVPAEVEEVILTALKKNPHQRFASVQAFSIAIAQASQVTPSSPSLPPVRPVSSPSLPLMPVQPGSPEVMTPPTQQHPRSEAPFTPVPSTHTPSAPTSATPIPVSQAAVNNLQASADIAQEQTVRIVPSPQPVAQKQRASISRRLAVAGLAGLAVAGGIGLAMWFNRSTARPAVPSPVVIPPLAHPTDYTGFGFDAQRTHFNSIEQQLSPRTVALLKPYWTASTGATINSSPAVVDRVVYIGSDDQKLYALSADTGKPVWIASTNGRVYSSPTVNNGTVYVASSDGTLYAFDAKSGKIRWRASTGNQIYSSPIVVNGLLYIGSFDSKLYAFDATTGERRWSTATDVYIVSSPACSNGTVYIGTGGGKLYAINAGDGHVIWSATLGSRITSSPTVAQNLVYVGSSDKNLYALDASNGSAVWSAATQDVVASSPAVDKGTVYIGSADSHIYAFQARTGKLLWSTQTYNQVNSSPTVANGLVYVGSWDGLVYACDAATGQVLWTGYTSDHIFSSPAVVNGVVYIGSWDTKVYAFSLQK
jgi:eukaryotic-like serine/threonine-protein kinase